MSKIELRYVDSYIDRLGKRRYYFRRSRGPRTTLMGEPGSDMFMSAYSAALAASEPRNAVIARVGPVEGSLAALAALYYGTPQFKKLAPSSQSVYRGVIDRFNEKHGDKRVATLRYQHVAKIIGDMSDRPGAAVVLLKRLRTLLAFAVKLGWITTNPATGVEGYAGEEFHTWTEAEIAQFESRWPLGTPQRLAFDTLLYTGQRISDAHVMPVPDGEGKMRFTQQKTGRRMVVRAHQRLVASIAAASVQHAVINVTVHGKPRSTKGFGNFMADAIAAAGLPDACVSHGLRKAAARRLAEIGCSPHEIMALTGHTTLSEVERYTRAVEQEALNERATARQEANETP